MPLSVSPVYLFSTDGVKNHSLVGRVFVCCTTKTRKGKYLLWILVDGVSCSAAAENSVLVD